MNMGMKLDVLFRLNAHGNWGGCIIDKKTGMMAAIPLDQDLLPVLDLIGAEKMPYPSVPDSLEVTNHNEISKYGQNEAVGVKGENVTILCSLFVLVSFWGRF